MNMGAKSGTHMVDLLFTLALFCVFAASALMVVLIGASVYKNTVAQMDENFTTHTSLTYVATKIRQNDARDAAYIARLEGEIPALVLERRLDNEVYQTWIFHYDGALRECFVKAGSAVGPDGGQEILTVADFGISRSGNSFSLAATDKDGNTSAMTVTPRCGIAERGAAA